MSNNQKIVPEIEKTYAKEARRRLHEYRNGEVEAIPLDESIPEFWDRLEKIREQKSK